ncbi:MAG TPA: molybdenum cofactor guanylyltransferase [Candidatus Angelobacter sp.]|nr:molybdenum cofactor guanylyltransferase [Candidatus Angelobacter sp.]
MELSMYGNVTGFVLAGGKSSRMGANKALLALNGSTLVEGTKAIVEQVCERVFIVGSRQLYGAFGECYEDVYPNCGPLGGIHAALLNSRTAHSLIISVDTPFIRTDFLNYMIERALNSSAMVTAPRIGGVVQPLCAVFSRDFLPIVEAALKSGKYKVEPTFPQEQTLVLTEADLSQFEMAAEMFENLNTPEDFELARKRSSGQQP